MFKQLITLSISCYFFTTSAYARNWYFGPKAAFIEPDESVIATSDNADNAGAVIGYSWLQSFGIISVEADFSTSFLDGSVSKEGVPINEDFFIDTFSAHLTYKAPMFSTSLGVYTKVKIGTTYYKATNTNSIIKEEIEPSFGGGLGIHLGKVTLEFDYTIINDLNDFNQFSFAVLF